MKKNVWIMNHYATDMILNKGGRHYNFIENLKSRENEKSINSSFSAKFRWTI